MFCPEFAKEHQISPSVLSIITQQKSKQRSLREDRCFFTVSKFEVVCCEGMPVDLFAATPWAEYLHSMAPMVTK